MVLVREGLGSMYEAEGDDGNDAGVGKNPADEGGAP
jgi:hypothetical protein